MSKSSYEDVGGFEMGELVRESVKKESVYEHPKEYSILCGDADCKLVKDEDCLPKYFEEPKDPTGTIPAVVIGRSRVVHPEGIQADVNDVEYGYVSKPKSKATTQNPKDLLGIKKPSLTKVPHVALVHESLAMTDGAQKYGPYNWRDNAVIASIYVDACLRHLGLWFEGQETASDSHVHHLGHARACLGILLDALETGNLIDDRPIVEGSKSAVDRVYDNAMDVVKFLNTKNAKKV